MTTAKPNIPIHELSPDPGDDVRFKLLELTQRDHDISSEPHRHGFYEIFFFESGEGEHMIDFKTYVIGARSLHFVTPGQVHMLNRSGESKGFVLMFSEEFYYFDRENKYLLRNIPFLNGESLKPAFSLDKDFAKVLMDLLHEIRSEYDSSDPYREDIIRAYINIFLLRCKTRLASEITISTEGVNHVVRQFKINIDTHFKTRHRVSDYADELSISANHLNDVVKKHTGRTAGELIQERLLLEARRLLLYSAATAKEIAYALGFNDPAYFSRFFKNHIGQTPEEFRQKLREKYASS
jgi:AraC family transcriptional regulator, transcriptional activator of pobA